MPWLATVVANYLLMSGAFSRGLVLKNFLAKNIFSSNAFSIAAFKVVTSRAFIKAPTGSFNPSIFMALVPSINADDSQKKKKKIIKENKIKKKILTHQSAPPLQLQGEPAPLATWHSRSTSIVNRDIL